MEGGARIIYDWSSPAGQIFLLYLYPKSARTDLAPTELRTLRALVSVD